MFPPLSRRRFITSSAALAAMAAMPRPVGAALSTSSGFRNIVTGRKLRIAHIGIGNKGYVDVMSCAATGEDIVALCDVDFNRGSRAGHLAFHVLPKAARYRDYRQMLMEMDDQIDAVVISTPDHTHFPAAMMALERGKHIYVQKPLTHTIGEARLLKAAATKARVVTQMGNQGHAYEGVRLIKEWIDADVIGPVRECITWTNRPIWPPVAKQFVPAPIPPKLDWNLWIGTGPWHEYSPAIAPWNWRAWWEYGSGGLGDMGCHLMDGAFWALDLRGSMKVSAESEGCTDFSAPVWSIVHYEFPARGSLPPLKYTWYDGGKLPARPEELGLDRKMPTKSATLYRGDKGTILSEGDYNNSVRLIPESRMKTFIDRPPKVIPRVPQGNPYLEWITACKGGPTPGSNIVDYSADLTETVLVGNLALRLGRPIEWDATTGTCVGLPEADKFIYPTYRLF